jgi:hypothetical protein
METITADIPLNSLGHWVRCYDTVLTLTFSEEFLTGAQALFLMNSISATTDTGLY